MREFLSQTDETKGSFDKSSLAERKRAGKAGPTSTLYECTPMRADRLTQQSGRDTKYSAVRSIWHRAHSVRRSPPASSVIFGNGHAYPSVHKNPVG